MELFKQQEIAEYIKVLLANQRKLAKKLNEELLEAEMDVADGGFDFGGTSGGYYSEYLFHTVEVTSVVDESTILALRTRPGTDAADPWVIDSEFSTKALTITIPSGGSAPSVGDDILAVFVGTKPTTPFGAVYTPAAAGGGQDTQYVVKQEFGDYLRCRTLVGSTEGGTDVYVAKPYKIRRTPFDGLTVHSITYGYLSNTSRNATVGGDTRNQKVIPLYQTSEPLDVLYARRATATNVLTDDSTPVQWVDGNNDGRGWAVN